MDFKKLLESFDTINENIKHKSTGNYSGNIHDPEEKRDEYGHRIPAPKKASAPVGAPDQTDKFAGSTSGLAGAFGSRLPADDSKHMKAFKTRKHTPMKNADDEERKLEKQIRGERGSIKEASFKDWMKHVEESKTLNEMQPLMPLVAGGQQPTAGQTSSDPKSQQTTQQTLQQQQADKSSTPSNVQQQNANKALAQLKSIPGAKFSNPGNTLKVLADPQAAMNNPSLKAAAAELGTMTAAQASDPNAQNKSIQALKTLAGDQKKGAVASMSESKRSEQNMAEDSLEESGLQAYLGNKKYGKDGMNALRKAGQEHASEKTKQNIRAKYSSKEDVVEVTGDQKFDSMMSKMTAEPKYPDKEMPPTSVPELIKWANMNNKPDHKYFAQWARRNGYTNVNDALVWFGDNVDPTMPWGPKDFEDVWGNPAAEWLEDAARYDNQAKELMKVYNCYEKIVFDWPDEYRQMNMPGSREGIDEGSEKWIKGAIKHPGSFSAKAKRAGETTAQYAREKSHAPGTLGKQARLAQTLSKMKKESIEFKTLTKLVESINFQDLIKNADQDVENMLAELQADVEEFKTTGHCSDLLDSFLKVHFHHAKEKQGAMQHDPLLGDVEEGAHTQHYMDANKPSAIRQNAEIAKAPSTPTSFKTDPIQAVTDRAINAGSKSLGFLKGLGSKNTPMKTFEGKNMKDIQLESWETQLNSLLTEGVTVSTSKGQEGAPDSVSINATDADAEQLMSILRNSGMDGFGGGVEQGHQGHEEMSMHQPEGNGNTPEPSPEVAGDDGDILSLIKKMAGGGATVPGTAEVEVDYEPEVTHADIEADDQEQATAGSEMGDMMKKMSDIESGEDSEEPCDDCGHSPCDCDSHDHGSDNHKEQDGSEKSDEEDKDKIDEAKWNPTREVKQSAREYMKSNGLHSVHDLDAEAIEYIGNENQINYEEVCKILGCELPEELGPVDADNDVEEGAGVMHFKDEQAKKAGKDHFELGGKTFPVKEDDMEEGNAYGLAARNTPKGKHIKIHGHDTGEIRTEDEHAQDCMECGMTMEECECPIEESYANSNDDTAFQDLQYMIKTLSGGINGPKHSQATGNIQKVTMETKLLKDSTGLLVDFQKLSGIK